MGYLLPEERARCNKSRRDKELRVSPNASPVLERQNWSTVVCPRLVRRGNKEEEQGVEMKHSNAAVAKLHPQQAGMPVEGESVWYLSRDEASTGKGSCLWGKEHKGIQGRGMLGCPSLIFPAWTIWKCPALWCAKKQMRCLTEASSTPGRSTRGTCQTACSFVLTWEMGQHLCTATNPFCVAWGDGNYRQACALREARSCVMFWVQKGGLCGWYCYCRSAGPMALCMLRKNRCQQKPFLLNWYFKIVTKDP